MCLVWSGLVLRVTGWMNDRVHDSEQVSDQSLIHPFAESNRCLSVPVPILSKRGVLLRYTLALEKNGSSV